MRNGMGSLWESMSHHWGSLEKSRIDGLIWGQMISRQIDGPRNAGKSHLVEHLHLNDLERRPKTIQMEKAEKVPKRRILYTMVSQHSHEKSTVWMVFTRGIFNSELFVYRRVFQMNHFQLYLRKKPLYWGFTYKKWHFKYLHKRSRVRVANHFWFQQIRHWNAGWCACYAAMVWNFKTVGTDSFHQLFWIIKLCINMDRKSSDPLHPKKIETKTHRLYLVYFQSFDASLYGKGPLSRVRHVYFHRSKALPGSRLLRSSWDAQHDRLILRLKELFGA